MFKDEAVISSYSRKQAIEDGVLIDVSKLAKEAGIKYPVAVTAAAWEQYVVPPLDSAGQSETGRMWDVLNVFRFSARGTAGDILYFNVLFLMRGNRRCEGTFKAVVGPGDDPEPVITIMLPEED